MRAGGTRADMVRDRAIVRGGAATLDRYAATRAVDRRHAAQRLAVPVLDDGALPLVAHCRIGL